MKRLIFLFLLAAGFSAGAQVNQVAPDTGYKFSVALPVGHDVEVVAIMSSSNSEIVSLTSISDYTYPALSQIVAFQEPVNSYPIDSGIGWCSSNKFLSNYDLTLFDTDNSSVDFVKRE